MQSLQPVQNAAIRIATEAYETSLVLSLHANSGIISLKKSIENNINYTYLGVSLDLIIIPRYHYYHTQVPSFIKVFY